MSKRTLVEILHSIAEACLGSAVLDEVPLAVQINKNGWEQALARALQDELEVELTVEELASAGTLLRLSELLESRLGRDRKGRSVVEIYEGVEEIVRDELSHKINYHWHATWMGDVLNRSDSLEDVEIIIRMEETFGISITDRDAQAMHTVRQTIRYLWRRLRETGQ